jgi:hypothetical protein
MLATEVDGVDVDVETSFGPRIRLTVAIGIADSAAN